MSKLGKRKKNPSSTYWKSRADAAWSALIRQAGVCEICGRPGHDPHHLIPRSAIGFWHDPRNGVCLCARCHVWNNGAGGAISAHGTPWAFAEWLERERPEKHAWWLENRRRVETGGKPDYKARCEELAKLLKEAE